MHLYGVAHHLRRVRDGLRLPSSSDRRLPGPGAARSAVARVGITVRDGIRAGDWNLAASCAQECQQVQREATDGLRTRFAPRRRELDTGVTQSVLASIAASRGEADLAAQLLAEPRKSHAVEGQLRESMPAASTGLYRTSRSARSRGRTKTPYA